jgi:hypothetical protein
MRSSIRKDGDTSMTITRLRRRALTLGVLVAVAAAATAAPQPAIADGTRIINGTTTCANGTVSYGFSVNLGAGWEYADSSYQVDSRTKVWTKVISSSATSVALDSFCYYSNPDFFPYGTWNGWTYSITPGTSTINSSWTCDRHPVYPGPFIRTCAMTAISYA